MQNQNQQFNSQQGSVLLHSMELSNSNSGNHKPFYNDPNAAAAAAVLNSAGFYSNNPNNNKFIPNNHIDNGSMRYGRY
jgi:hypothetical protein